MPFGNSYPVIELDSRNVNEVEVAPIILSQGDSSGRIIRYALWDGQDAMSGTGLSARFCIDQDEGLYAAMTAVAGASTATFQAAVPMGGVEAGWHAGCIRVSDSGGRVINTRLFKVYVEKSAIGSSAEQITAYADIISGAEDATTAANTAATAANNAAASAIAASENRLTGTLYGTGATPQTASDAWTGPLIGATVDGLSTQDGTPTPSAPVAIKSVEGAAAVVAGRNLLPQLTPTTISGVTISYDADGYLVLNGTSTAVINRGTTFHQSLRHETYTMSAGNETANANVSVRLNNNSSKGVNCTEANATKTFTVDSEATAWNIRIASGVTLSNFKLRPQLELGSEAHAWEPYAGTTTDLLPASADPLRSLPDGTHDELTVGRDGTVTVVRRVGSVTYDGDEGHAGLTTVNDIRCIYYSFGIVPTAPNGNPGLCSAYTVDSDYRISTSRDNTCVISARSFGSNPMLVFLDNAHATDATTFKTWLASNPVTVEYPLATPTTETLPSVTMPTVPSANLTAWVDATDGDGAAIAAPWEMTYERDVTYVIEQLEQAIADL